LSISVFSGVIMVLVIVLLFVEAKVTVKGEHEITVNGNKDESLKINGTPTLLSALSSKNIFLPSACGGSGSCGMCKCEVTKGGGSILPTELSHLSRKDKLAGKRLSCQLKVKDDLEIKVPESIFGIKKVNATVVSNENVSTFIKELVLRPEERIDFKAGAYIQIDVPEYDLVFIGNMGYPPNVNAAEYLAKEILPLVHKTKPGVTLTLAGATPHPNVLSLKSKYVEVTGFVENIREAYAKAKIFIAPMRIGTGLQNKLLEAMAVKIPSITSSLANSALEAINGEQILVGNTTEEFAAHIIKLLDDERLAEQIAENGYQFVHAKYNWESATKKLEDLMMGNKS